MQSYRNPALHDCREAQAILDQLVEISRRIEAHEAEVWRLRLERK